jgi:DGQHR domain-containing protein
MTEYNGLLISQAAKGPAFFAFSDTASEILKWADVKRTYDTRRGAQRLFSKSHAKSIKNFLLDDHNVIPTAVILALPKDTYVVEKYDVTGVDLSSKTSFATLRISVDGVNKVGTVIDGQHRLLALEGTPAPLLVSVLLDVDTVEEAIQFVVINNKAKRVPSDLVKAIIAEMPVADRGKFEKRVERIRLSLGSYHNALNILFSDNASPFKGLLDWDLNRKGKRIVKPLALETGLKRIMLDLRFPELDLDDAVQIFASLWRGVKSAYSQTVNVWGPAPSKLLSKAVIVALTDYFVERINLKLEEGFDPTDLDAVSKYSEDTIKGIPAEFWLITWARKSLDTSAGRDLIKEAISNMKRAEAMGHDEEILTAADWFLNTGEE